LSDCNISDIKQHATLGLRKILRAGNGLKS